MDDAADKMLLILDVDETLVYAAESPLEREADFRAGPYFVYRRPHLDEFLGTCRDQFAMAVWSSSGGAYLEAVLRAILPADIRPAFVWDRERCVRRFDVERQETCFVKDLRKVKRMGYDLRRVLIVDDTPQKVHRHYGNAIYVSSFVGDSADDELLHLGRYLPSLCSAADVRRVEKRGWRRRT